MAKDQYGNYVADDGNMNLNAVAPLPGIGIITGHGAPTVNTPIGLVYIDLDSGDLYTNPTLTPTGWVPAGGGGSSAVTNGAGDPITLGISVVEFKLFINDNDTTLWCVANGAWSQLV